MPFHDLEVNIHALGNEFWDRRYRLKIPVIHLYRRKEYQDSSAPKSKFHELEGAFWNDVLWESPETKWIREVLCVMDFQKRALKFKDSSELMKWIWKT